MITPLKPALHKINLQLSQAIPGNLSMTMDFEEQMPASLYPSLLEFLLRKDGQSYSVWHSLGSEMVKPCLLLSKGLPPARGLTALIDGNWSQHNWFKPINSLSAVQSDESKIPEEVI